MAVRGYDTLINDLNRVIQDRKVFIAAINSVLAEQKKRIFEQGKSESKQL